MEQQLVQTLGEKYRANHKELLDKQRFKDQKTDAAIQCQLVCQECSMLKEQIEVQREQMLGENE